MGYPKFIVSNQKEKLFIYKGADSIFFMRASM